MCSVGDDIEDQENQKYMPSKIALNLRDSKCLKCRTESPKVVLHSQYPYCEPCFLAATVHKFKALLGKHRAVKLNEKVLICHKAGHPSTAMLHLLRSGLDLSTPKRIRFKPIVLYVETNFKLPLSERKKILELISCEVTRFNFQVYFVSLTEYALDPDNLPNLVKGDFKDLQLDDSDADRMKSCTKQKVNSTFLEEIYRILERNLVVGVAKLLDAKCIFTPELSHEIASQLLTTVALGRGAHVTHEVGTFDVRENVSIMRPLRYFTVKELAFYNIFNKVEPVSFVKKMNSGRSVQNLMSEFVSDLQTNYPATISTIVKTGDKLCVNKSMLGNEKCLLCKGSIDNQDIKLGSAEATNFSHDVSLQSLTLNEPIVGKENEDAVDKEKSKYCYTCQRIIIFMK